MSGCGRAPLSSRQIEVLRIIQRVIEAVGEPPSAYAIARRLGVHPSVVQEHLAALYRKGWLDSPSPAGVRCLHGPDAQTLPDA